MQDISWVLIMAVGVIMALTATLWQRKLYLEARINWQRDAAISTLGIVGLVLIVIGFIIGVYSS